jgi:deoxycytidylate deaminase
MISIGYAEHGLEVATLVIHLAARAAVHVRRSGPLIGAAPFHLLGPSVLFVPMTRQEAVCLLADIMRTTAILNVYVMAAGYTPWRTAPIAYARSWHPRRYRAPHGARSACLACCALPKPPAAQIARQAPLEQHLQHFRGRCRNTTRTLSVPHDRNRGEFCPTRVRTYVRTQTMMPKTARTYPTIDPHELVLGMVYGAGAEAEPFQRTLEEALRRFGYELRTIRLSDYLPVLVKDNDFARDSPDEMRRLQDMGDKLRQITKRNDIAAQLGVYLMTMNRARESTAERRVAWLLRSLKRPEDIDALRRLYGARFVLFGLHVPDLVRRRNLSGRWQRWADVTSLSYEEEAVRDVRRDEEDRTSQYGQAVRDTFARADFFIDGRAKQCLQDSVRRSVNLIFGEPFEPPHRHEQAMYHAFAAGLRSTEMGRQVGAAIMSPRGDLLAVGTNDVPSPSGGLYWSPDEPDNRDFAREPPLDSNTLWQRRVTRELLVRMRHTGWLSTGRVKKLDGGGYDIDEERLDRFLDDVRPTRFRSLTEFGRSVHAEMDAITAAARNGIAIEGATLVSTTFPCHNCTRHLIAAGLRHVLYIYPYTKSLARDLHGDAVLIEPENPGPRPGKVVLEQYIGVAPRVYPQYFSFDLVDRKEPRGRALGSSTPKNSAPRVLEDSGPFAFGGPTFPIERTVALEQELVTDFSALIRTRSRLALPIGQ